MWGKWRAFFYNDVNGLIERKTFVMKEKSMITAAVMSLRQQEELESTWWVIGLQQEPGFLFFGTQWNTGNMWTNQDRAVNFVVGMYEGAHLMASIKMYLYQLDHNILKSLLVTALTILWTYFCVNRYTFQSSF